MCTVRVQHVSGRASGISRAQEPQVASGMLDRAGLDLGRVEGESISGRGGEELVVEIHSDDAGG